MTTYATNIDEVNSARLEAFKTIQKAAEALTAIAEDIEWAFPEQSPLVEDTLQLADEVRHLRNRINRAFLDRYGDDAFAAANQAASLILEGWNR